MTDTLLVDEIHTHEYLPHKVFDLVHCDQSSILLGILNDLFKILLAELKDQILDNLALLVLGVIYVQELNDVFTAS